jgi:hypothetical protein
VPGCATPLLVHRLVVGASDFNDEVATPSPSVAGM